MGWNLGGQRFKHQSSGSIAQSPCPTLGGPWALEAAPKVCGRGRGGAGQSLRMEGRGCPGADGGLLSVAGHTSVLDKLTESTLLNNHLFKPLRSLNRGLGNKHKSNEIFIPERGKKKGNGTCRSNKFWCEGNKFNKKGRD